MPQFRSKPVVIEAIRLREPGIVKTLEGDMLASKGDWLIKGIEGELYPCKDSVFRKKYEPVDTPAVREMSEIFSDEPELSVIPFPGITITEIA